MMAVTDVIGLSFFIILPVLIFLLSLVTFTSFPSTLGRKQLDFQTKHARYPPSVISKHEKTIVHLLPPSKINLPSFGINLVSFTALLFGCIERSILDRSTKYEGKIIFIEKSRNTMKLFGNYSRPIRSSLFALFPIIFNKKATPSY